MQVFKILGGLALLMTLGSAAAQEEAAAARVVAPVRIEIGAATDALLSLQRSGEAAGRVQPLQGEVAARSYQRYLDAYKQPTAIGRAADAAAPVPATASPR